MSRPRMWLEVRLASPARSWSKPRATGYTTTAASDGQRLPSDTLGRLLTVTDTAGRTTSTA
ncbi:hypothetical protein [Streptomyces sp. WG7]|uniref:hypothetical protein n=1 Tax=Streptomyces sp. WG7 TaxID=3417650 RepID=UPI003CE80913